MTKAFRILLLLLLGLTASLWLGATGVAPVAAVAPVAEAAQAVAPAPPAEVHGGGENVWVDSEGGSYLGVDTQNVTKERLADLKLKEERGVEVLMVDQDAPAGKAGLKEHDVILEFNGARVESVEQLRRMIHEMPPGRTVALGISRDGQPMTLNATLADRHKSYSFAYSGPKVKMPKLPKMPEMPEMPEMGNAWVISGSSRSGLLVENLTPQLGEFFGVKNGAGVLVRSVEKGSSAEAAGFRAGDVIVRVEQEKVGDKGDWRSAMRTHRSGKVAIGIIRDKREQTLSLVLPESKEQSSAWHSFGPEMDLDMDMDDMDIDLEDMDIEINHLTPQMERLKPEMLRLKPEMERLKRELSGQLTASLTQNRDHLRQAVALAREQRSAVRRIQLDAVHTGQLDAVRAAQRAQVEARRAVERQRRELDKARLMMLRTREMD
jgi:membrane-associated protease RseP (regulator of RpoE activity)